MKRLAKISLIFSLFAAAVMPSFAQNDVETASAATLWKGTATGYTKASDVKYVTNGKYRANWGARDEACVFLTSYATDFYTGSYTYEQLSLNAGSTNTSSVPNSALYKALNGLVKSKQTYETSYKATRDLFCYTDCVNGNYSNISSFYSAAKLSGTWDSGATWNREHTWPNSKGDANGNGENDIMMLRPTATSENGSRGNTAYGPSSSYYDPNCEGQNVRGDCARIILYVYTRWGTQNMWGTGGVMESKDVLLKWMEEDPVDTWEMGRNDATQAILGTRNVYVDYPELAWQLFGETAPTDMVTPSGKASNGTATPTPTPTPTPDPDEPETPDTPDTPTLPSVTSGLEEGKAYTVTANNVNGAVYLTTGITTGRFNGSANASDAVHVYVENVSGGQLLYIMNGTTKTYFVVNDESKGAATTTSADSATVFEWNSSLNTLVVAEDSNNRALALDSSKDFTTFSTYDASNNYSWGQFTVVGGTEQPDPETPVDPTPTPDPDTPDTPDTPVIPEPSPDVTPDPVTSGLEEGKAYVVTANNVNGAVYLTTGITTGRFNGSANGTDAIYVYAENVDGGQLLYTFPDGTTKTYFVVNDESKGAATTTSADSATVFEWNSSLNTLVVADDNNNRALALDSTKDFTTFSTYDTQNNYSWAQFTLVKAAQPDTPVEPDTPDTPVNPDPDTPVNPNPDTPVNPNPETPVDPDVPNGDGTTSDEEKFCPHKYTEWEVVTPATAETEGLERHSCRYCGKTEERTIPVLTEDGESADENSDANENSGDAMSDMLAGLTVGCEASIGLSMVGMALLTAGFALLKRKDNE